MLISNGVHSALALRVCFPFSFSKQSSNMNNAKECVRDGKRERKKNECKMIAIEINERELDKTNENPYVTKSWMALSCPAPPHSPFLFFIPFSQLDYIHCDFDPEFQIRKSQKYYWQYKLNATKKKEKEKKILVFDEMQMCLRISWTFFVLVSLSTFFFKMLNSYIPRHSYPIVFFFFFFFNLNSKSVVMAEGKVN